LQLQKSGYDVTVVEAQDIPGGRVETIRKHFTNGGYAEAGAVRIYSNHRWTMQYVKQMGLESKLAAYDDDTGTKLWYLQGKRFTTPQGEWPLAGLTAQEKANPFAMIGQYWGAGLRAIGNVLDPDYPGAAARALDLHSMDGFFRKQGASDACGRSRLQPHERAGRHGGRRHRKRRWPAEDVRTQGRQRSAA
jgi:monoamine oxidase